MQKLEKNIKNTLEDLLKKELRFSGSSSYQLLDSSPEKDPRMCEHIDHLQSNTHTGQVEPFAVRACENYLQKNFNKNPSSFFNPGGSSNHMASTNTGRILNDLESPHSFSEGPSSFSLGDEFEEGLEPTKNENTGGFGDINSLSGNSSSRGLGGLGGSGSSGASNENDSPERRFRGRRASWQVGSGFPRLKRQGNNYNSYSSNKLRASLSKNMKENLKKYIPRGTFHNGKIGLKHESIFHMLSRRIRIYCRDNSHCR